jgi:hypothetical protein
LFGAQLAQGGSKRLANVGCTHEQTKALTGRRSDTSLAPYTCAAGQERPPRQAMQMLVETKGEQKELQHLIHAVPKAS